MKKVIFVIGPPNSGKSFFINKYLIDYKHIDLYDYQKYAVSTVESIMQSYNDCAAALTDACKRYDKVVLEHTLMKRKRRGQFVDAVKEALGSDVRIKCFYTNIDLDTYKKFDAKNLAEFDNHGKLLSDKELAMFLDGFEKPVVEDGFCEIEEIKI